MDEGNENMDIDNAGEEMQKIGKRNAGEEMHENMDIDKSDSTQIKESLQENIDDNLILQNVNSDKLDSALIKEPFAGMEFKSLDEAFEFYKDYGNKVGFPIRRRTGKTNAKYGLRYEVFTCARDGKPNKKEGVLLHSSLSVKTNCKARIRLKVYDDGRVVINSTILEHNHDVSPRKARFFRCNRNIGAAAKRKLVLGDQAEISTAKSFNAIVVEHGGHENVPFLEKDCRNFVEKARRLRLGVGDGEAICSYFSQMQKRNSNFFYAIDLDDENRLKNIFWADARSRSAYKSFSDVITFDTTYLTNKYDMPFAPFVGVNHHGQSILFGCGLLSSEDNTTFEWLFKQWLTCMSDKAPGAIITDQDQAMKLAIQGIFPDTTRHRWCLWHIMKKIPEKLSSFPEYVHIKADLVNVVYDSESKSDFEVKWAAMLDKYNLHANRWLESLYKNRSHWVPIFVKDSFWAGMSTTQRSEGMNAFFDGYVNSKTTLRQFVEQYENALKSKVEKELYEDFKSFNNERSCVSVFEMEKVFQKAYTNAKFCEVQEEFKGIMYCNVTFVEKVGVISRYSVSDKVYEGQTASKRVIYTVYFNEKEVDIKCSCNLFEFRGILCRHAIRVFDHNEIDYIPPKYMLDRWRKDIKREYTMVKVSYRDLNDTPELKRYDEIIEKAHEVAEFGSISDIDKKMVLDCMDDLIKKLIRFESVSTCPPHSAGAIKCNVTISNPVHSPVAIRRKGRPPTERKQSKVEKISKNTRKRQSNSDNKNDAKDLVKSVQISKTTIRRKKQDAEKQVRKIVAENPRQASQTHSIEHNECPIPAEY